MRTPSWEAAPGALAALLNTRNDLVVLDLYTITLPGGQVLRWSGTDVAIGINGNNWALGPGLQRGRTKLTIGVQVDTLDVTVFADDSVTVNGVPLLRFIARGGFDNARLQVDRAYMSGTGTAVVGTLLWFAGRIAEAQADRTQARLQVRSDTELLDVMVPREVYQPGCTATLYDSACGVSRAARAVAGVAGAGNAARNAFAHTLPQAAGYFELGVVAFTSGANAGATRTVKSHTAGQLVVLSPLPFAVAAGDLFTVTPGCDKTMSTCRDKFNNLLRFRGQPFVPAPETIA